MSELPIHLGIDPGYASGAVCLYRSDGKVSFIDITNDWSEVTAHLRELSKIKHRIKFAVLEKVGPVRKQGIVGAFTFGSGYGALWCWLLYEQIPHMIVTPQEWHQHVHTKKPRLTAKEKAKDYVMMKYPRLFQEKFDHNRADALCLAEHARRLSP